MPIAPSPSAGRSHRSSRVNFRAWCRPASTRRSCIISRRSRRCGSASDGKAVVAKMKEMPTDDPLFGKGSIRADGRKIHPAYLFEVKKPEESKYPGDDYKLRATIPADEAFRPLRTATVRWSAAKSSPDGTAARECGRPSWRIWGMFEIFGIPSQALFGQLLLGLINGSFYALLSLGLAVIFGMLNIINFAHGAQYMMGAFAAYLLAAISRPQLLGGAGPRADRGRRDRHDHRAAVPAAFAQARSVSTGCC